MMTNNNPYKIRSLQEAVSASLLGDRYTSIRTNTIVQFIANGEESVQFNGKTASIVRRIPGVTGRNGQPAKLVVQMVGTKQEVVLNPENHPNLYMQVQTRGHGPLLMIRKPNARTIFKNATARPDSQKPAVKPEVAVHGTDNQLAILSSTPIPSSVQDLIQALQNGAEAENSLKNMAKTMSPIFKGKAGLSLEDQVKHLVNIVRKVQGLGL